MALTSLTSIIGKLQERAGKLREEGERSLILSMCSGAAILFSTLIGWICYLKYNSIFALWAGSMLSAGVLVPLSLFFGVVMFGRLKSKWVTSGNIFKRLRYLEYEYNEDIRRIRYLLLPKVEQEKLISERHQQFLKDTSEFREQIRNLRKESQSNLLKD